MCICLRSTLLITAFSDSEYVHHVVCTVHIAYRICYKCLTLMMIHNQNLLIERWQQAIRGCSPTISHNSKNNGELIKAHNQ